MHFVPPVPHARSLASRITRVVARSSQILLSFIHVFLPNGGNDSHAIRPSLLFFAFILALNPPLRRRMPAAQTLSPFQCPTM